MLFLILNLCVLSQVEAQKYDLSNINTIKEAESYYNSCMSIPYEDCISTDDMIEMVHRLFALSQRICMRSIDDINDIDRYNCEIQVPNESEEKKLERLRSKVSQSYLCVQQLLSPFGKQQVDDYTWRNFENYYSGIYKRIYNTFIQKIVWYETEINGIKFIEFHNLDDSFAYDIKVYHESNNKNTLVREFSLMPRKVKVISSSIDGTNIYFTPSSVEITNKYHK